MRVAVFACVAMAAGAAVAQQSSKDAFMRQQAYAEMQRVSGQVDVLQSNFEDLSARVRRIEGSDGSRGLQAEIDSLRAQIADLKREMVAMRGEIVKDLTAKIVQIQRAQTPATPTPPPPKPKVIGPHLEYEVVAGDSLSIIARAFGTTVDKIKEMNSLKNNNLRIGQKLMIPKK